MEASVVRPPLPAPRRELVIGALVTAVVAALLLTFGPAPGDAPAHLYRTWLVHQGALLWDNLWFAGHYPLASYSFLYYLVAAVVGNLPLVFVSAVVSPALFASIAYREWGDAARWPSRVFAVLAAAPLFTGLYSYSLGFTAMLAALEAFQKGKLWLAALFAALTLGFSPLAFVFLCVILAAVFVAHRRFTRRTLVISGTLGTIAAAGLAVMIVFPSNGVYTFNPVDFGSALGTCAVGTLLARRAPRARALMAFFVIWGVASIVCYMFPNPVGDNITRLRAFVLPVMLLTAILVRFRPRWLVVVALGVALGYNVVPYLMLIPYRLDGRPTTQRFWAPALGYVKSGSEPNYRIEVVPTAAHWESYWVPHSGLALARGFYRQLDIADNPMLFHKRLTPTTYVAWLRSEGIRYVLVPATKLDPFFGPAEARIVRSPATGLHPVFTSVTGTVYELPDASPILTGPAPSWLTSLGHETLSGWISAPGRYFLRIRYSPYWHVGPRGEYCVAKGRDGMIELVARRAGPFSLRVRGNAEDVLDGLAAVGKRPAC